MDRFKRLLFSQTSKDTLISFSGLAIIAVVGMLFSVITARGMGPTTFGLFSALNAVVSLLASMGDLGISASLVNFLPKVADRRNILISVTFWFQIIVTLLITLLLLAAGLVHGLIIPGSTTLHFTLIALLTAFYILQGFALGIFNAEKKFFQAAFIQGSDSVVKLTIVAALFFSNHLNIELALLANLISCFLSLAYGFWGEFKNIRPIFPRSQLAEIFTFSKWIALSRFFSVMVSRVDIIILNILAGAYQTGIFSAASRITLVFALLVSSLGSVIAPRFSSFISKADVKKYLFKVGLMVGGVTLVMLLSIIIAQPLVYFVFGAKYLPSVPVFQALTIAMIPFLLSVTTTTPLVYSLNQPHFFAKLTIMQVVIIVVLDILLIPKFLAFAPAISLGVANTLVLLISGYKLARLLR